MVKIRLFRTGKTKRPMYRIVAIDSRRKRQGRVLQTLGTYRPGTGGASTLNEGALEHWVGRGAQLSDTVRALVRGHRKAPPAAEPESEPTPDVAAPAGSTESAPAS